MRARSAGSNGRVRKSRRRARVVSPAPSISTSAASIPSALVPEMRPTTRRGLAVRSARNRVSGSPFTPSLPERRAQIVAVGGKALRRLLRRPAPSRCITSATFGRPPARRARARAPLGRQASELPDHAERASAELPARWPEVDHQIAVDLAEPNHRARRDRVENHLGGEPRLHAGRARQHLRTGPRRDDHVGELTERRRRRARDDDRPGTAPPPLFERGQCERRHAARADPAHHVPRTYAEPPKRPAGVGASILGSFDSSPERPAAAGDHAHHTGPATRRRWVGTPTSGPQPPAGAGASVTSRPPAPAPRPPDRRPGRGPPDPRDAAAARRSSRVMVVTRRSVEADRAPGTRIRPLRRRAA